MTLADIVRAYRAPHAPRRDPREQEADIFRRVTGSLRAVQQQDGPARVRAVADNRRLWLAVESAVIDPSNQLPPQMRAGLISIGRAVQREMDQGDPDIAFLIEINEQVAQGLTGLA